MQFISWVICVIIRAKGVRVSVQSESPNLSMKLLSGKNERESPKSWPFMALYCTVFLLQIIMQKLVLFRITALPKPLTTINTVIVIGQSGNSMTEEHSPFTRALKLRNTRI